jgi:DNA-binding HxlR family transcriptional regulator
MQFPSHSGYEVRSGAVGAEHAFARQVTSRFIGRRHVLSILSRLANLGTARLGELRAALGEPSTSTLAAALSDLTKRRLIHRAVYPEKPPRVQYSLTAQGLRVCRLLSQMRRRTT